jgi:hypothetical protein
MADCVGRGSDILYTFELEATAATFGDRDLGFHSVDNTHVWAILNKTSKRNHYATSNMTSISSVLLMAQVNGVVGEIVVN